MIWAVVLVAVAGFGVLVYWNKKLHEKHMQEIQLWHDAHEKQLETQAVLLEKAQNIASVAIYWWTLVPAVFVVITVMAYNFLGDGLRDAADPYKQ